MVSLHIVPVEIKPCVEVPQGSHHPFSISILIHVDAAGSGKFHIIDKLLDLQVMNERANVEQRLYQRIISVLDSGLQLGKHSFDGIFHL